MFTSGVLTHYYLWLALVLGLLVLTILWGEVSENSYLGRKRLGKLFQLRVSTFTLFIGLVGASTLLAILLGVNGWGTLPAAVVLLSVLAGVVFAAVSLAWYFWRQLRQ